MYVLLKFRKVHYGNIDQEHLSSPSTLGGGAFPIMAYISGGEGETPHERGRCSGGILKGMVFTR